MHNQPSSPILIYTDGSCHTQLRLGSWVAILFIEGAKIILQGIKEDTSNNRMELTAAIKAFQYLLDHKITAGTISLITDSQYLADLPSRIEKLSGNSFITKSGNAVQNYDLILLLIEQLNIFEVTITKIPAHQKKSETVNYNREADMLARKILRAEIRKRCG
jgi:ribonuclease HI